MLPRFEYGHLYKFAVSLGLLLVGLSVALPWLVLRDSGPLLVSRQAIEGLTPRARRVIEQKQRQYAWIVEHYAIGSATLAGAGTGISVYGFVKWKKRQDVMDEMEDVQKDTAKAKLRDLSAVEVDDKLDREAAEVLTDAMQPTTAELEEQPSYNVDHRSIRARIVAFEDLAIGRLAEAFGATHDVRRNARLERGDWARYEVDAIVQPRRPGDTSYVVELKLARHARTILDRVRDGILQTAQMATAYEPLAPGPVHGLLLLVGEEPSTRGDLDRARAAFVRWVGEIGGAMAVPVHALLLTREELATIPADQLRAAVETSGVLDF